MRFETFVREGILNREHVVSIFFDLEKAYDTTWKYGIMKNLHDMDFRGRLPLFIQNFLSERKFRVRVRTSLSDFYDQEMEVPRSKHIHSLRKPKVASGRYAAQWIILCDLRLL